LRIEQRKRKIDIGCAGHILVDCMDKNQSRWCGGNVMPESQRAVGAEGVYLVCLATFGGQTKRFLENRLARTPLEAVGVDAATRSASRVVLKS